jgi:hypothetical protein
MRRKYREGNEEVKGDEAGSITQMCKLKRNTLSRLRSIELNSFCCFVSRKRKRKRDRTEQLLLFRQSEKEKEARRKREGNDKELRRKQEGNEEDTR